MRRYELRDHTADIAIAAFGRTLEETFENAAYAMFDQVTDLRAVPGFPIERTFRLTAESPELLLREWLGELLFIAETDHLVFGRFEVCFPDQRSLRGTAWGVPASDVGADLSTGIKAVTYHDLRIRKTEDGFEASVVFDV